MLRVGIDYDIDFPVGEKEGVNESFDVEAARIGSTIYLSTDVTPATYLTHYFHECGHVIGDQKSFADLKHPSIAIAQQISLPYMGITVEHAKVLSWYLHSRKSLTAYDIQQVAPIADMILQFFCKDQEFNRPQVEHRKAKELNNLFNNNEKFLQKEKSGKVLVRPNLDTVAAEIPSIACELVCTRILSEIVAHYDKFHQRFALDPYIFLQYSFSHTLAQNLVAREAQTKNNLLFTPFEKKPLADVIFLLRESGHKEKMIQQLIKASGVTEPHQVPISFYLNKAIKSIQAI